MNIVNVGYRSTNYYVIADTAPRLLIDAGWPGTLGEMQHACNRMGIKLADIQYQLMTHYHPDHAGLVQELRRLGVQLVVIDTQLAGIPLLSTYVKPGDGYTEIELAGSIVLSAVESRAFLAGIGIQGEIISTPGHSDDSVTLILDDGLAFTGDLTPPMLVSPDPTDLAHRSWEAIRARGVTTVYPGHGPVGHL
ncbi:MAG TPA: MBL fold metallo-hydrolase [Chloroflexia bacterium]|jgi:glyoxylase-like metal-dependent hydrolase (beta-lactamase superfamily II)